MITNLIISGQDCNLTNGDCILFGIFFKADWLLDWLIVVKKTNRYQTPSFLTNWPVCVKNWYQTSWHLTNDHGYVPLVVNTSRSFPHSWLITGFVTRLTRWVSLEEQSWHFMTTLHLFMTFYDNITSFHDILWQHCIFSWHFMTTLHLFMTFYDNIASFHEILW
jgi:hypothetical protein